jgi:hypothetical protein
VSLHTFVQGGLAGRLHLRRTGAGGGVETESRVAEAAVHAEAGSMRGLEAIIALTSIATALLIGLGR